MARESIEVYIAALEAEKEAQRAELAEATRAAERENLVKGAREILEKAHKLEPESDSDHSFEVPKTKSRRG